MALRRFICARLRRLWELSPEILVSVSKTLFIYGLILGPIWLIICLARGHSIPGYITGPVGFAIDHVEIIFPVLILGLLLLFRSAYRSDRSKKPDQTDPPES